jgi:hypothetical protein
MQGNTTNVDSHMSRLMAHVSSPICSVVASISVSACSIACHSVTPRTLATTSSESLLFTLYSYACPTTTSLY